MRADWHHHRRKPKVGECCGHNGPIKRGIWKTIINGAALSLTRCISDSLVKHRAAAVNNVFIWQRNWIEGCRALTHQPQPQAIENGMHFVGPRKMFTNLKIQTQTERERQMLVSRSDTEVDVESQSQSNPHAKLRTVNALPRVDWWLRNIWQMILHKVRTIDRNRYDT